MVESEVYNLGEMVHESRINWFQQAIKLLIVFIGGFLLYAAIASGLNPDNPANQEGIGNQIGAIIGGLVSILLASGMAVSLGLALFKSLKLYEKGVIYKYLGRELQWMWDDFEELKLTHIELDNRPGRRSIINYTFFDLELKDGEGNKLHINKDFQSFRELASFGIKQVQTHLIRNHLNRFHAGETLRYGKLSLNKEYVQKGRNKRLWSEIDRWGLADTDDLGSAKIAFYNKDKILVFMLINNLPNYHVLLPLMTEIGDEVINT